MLVYLKCLIKILTLFLVIRYICSLQSRFFYQAYGSDPFPQLFRTYELLLHAFSFAQISVALFVWQKFGFLRNKRYVKCLFSVVVIFKVANLAWVKELCRIPPYPLVLPLASIKIKRDATYYSRCFGETEVHMEKEEESLVGQD